MTNAQIILNESIQLMENGIIGNTGRKIIVEDEGGEKKEMLEPESIHTYAGWKAVGRQVKKAKKALVRLEYGNTLQRKRNQNQKMRKNKKKCL